MPNVRTVWCRARKRSAQWVLHATANPIVDPAEIVETYVSTKATEYAVVDTDCSQSFEWAKEQRAKGKTIVFADEQHAGGVYTPRILGPADPLTVAMLTEDRWGVLPEPDEIG